MATALLDPKFGTSINQRFRAKRFKFFMSLLDKVKSDKPLKILDLGGYERYWERMGYLGDDNVHITLLNLEKEITKNQNFSSVAGDATNLHQFKDNEFDIVFSNSMIEHLFSRESQQKMADEARRVGKYYYIQTPNYYFPIEPHWLFPFFQFFPFSLRVFLTRKFNLGNIGKRSKKEDAIDIVNEIKLLTESDMKKLFPDGKVYREMFAGLKKSITMYRFPE
jgi:hypothetical protein